MLKTIERFLVSSFLKGIKKFYQLKENTAYIDICIVYCDNKNTIKFKTSTIENEVFDYSNIRSSVGQNKALINGLKPNEVILIVMPSCFKYRSIKSTLKFIKEWTGVSNIGNKKVVFYTFPIKRKAWISE